MPKYLVVSTSGNPDSNSRRMGQVAFAHLQKRKIDCAWLDIKDLELPLCDVDKCYNMPAAQKLNQAKPSSNLDFLLLEVRNPKSKAITITDPGDKEKMSVTVPSLAY